MLPIYCMHFFQPLHSYRESDYVIAAICSELYFKNPVISTQLHPSIGPYTPLFTLWGFIQFNLLYSVSSDHWNSVRSCCFPLRLQGSGRQQSVPSDPGRRLTMGIWQTDLPGSYDRYTGTGLTSLADIHRLTVGPGHHLWVEVQDWEWWSSSGIFCPISAGLVNHLFVQQKIIFAMSISKWLSIPVLKSHREAICPLQFCVSQGKMTNNRETYTLKNDIKTRPDLK